MRDRNYTEKYMLCGFVYMKFKNSVVIDRRTTVIYRA